ncbi:tetratricopeptide repeat protein [Nocardia salmonicida]|uniref:tetratricopeptide repeat protein n=1 Tax=Nocardia salmonicida TaxID=53431 RepID=UPI002E2E052C|nr:tetratricopeptide repeat protein [Nocardia salmonicida]
MRWKQLVGVTGTESGSGYLIAPRLVLTSAHVVGTNRTELTVTQPGQRGVYTATVRWCGRAGGVSDAALVEIDDLSWEPPAVGPVIWGRTVTHQPGIACRTWGLPDFAQRANKPTDTEQPTGTLNPGDGYVGNHHILHLNEHPPTGIVQSPWKGISGAAVYCGNLLTGVVATDPEGRDHAALGVVPAYVLLEQPLFRAVVEQHCGVTGLDWAPVELQELADHQSPTRDTTPARTPATLLAARRAVVGFRGREDLLTELRAWVEVAGVGAWLVQGAGGQGKTRLAHHLGTELTARRWSVVWLDPTIDTAPGLQVLGQVTTPLLVIVDYAEARAAQLGVLFTELAAHLGDRPVKVLLLARTVGEWWTQLTATSDAVADITAYTRHTGLLPLDADPAARQVTYRDAVHAFAEKLPALEDTDETVWEQAATAVSARPFRDLGDSTTVLGVQMSALADLLDTRHPNPPAVAGQQSLEDRVLDHEHRYWTATAGRHGLDGLGIATLKDVLAATIVLGTTTRKGLDEVLRRVPDLADQPGLIHTKVRGWLMSLYPGPVPGAYSGLVPDRLAEQLIGRLMLDPTRDCVIESLAATTDGGEAEQLLTVCSRANSHSTLTDTGALLTQWCVEYPTLHVAAVRVATRVENPEPLITALDRITTTPDIPPETLGALHDAIPHQTRVLADTAATLTLALTGHYRETGDYPLLALTLNNLSVRLGELGRREDGLTASEEAVWIYQRLAEQHPDAYLPTLAASLSNLANRLGALGRREDGLTASEEAVRIYQRLAEQHPDAYLPGLASSLNNLAVDLGALGRREDGLTAIEEAVRIYQRLAEQHPEAYLPDLAASLNNLSVQLGALGRREDGLTAIEEAVRIRRRLAEQHPDAYLPDLASSLNNLSNWSGESGRHEHGLTASEEAVRIYQRLAEQHPDAYLPDLALSLNNLAVDLGALGRREDGLTASEEAVRIRRRLAEQHPDAYLPDLASSLTNLGADLGALGHREDGLTASEEAVRIRRRLAEQHPDAYLPDLASSLNNLAIRLGALGRHEDGLTAIEEAVRIRRRLAEQHPDAYLPTLASSLTNLANRLGALGRREDGLPASEEAVRIYQRLAEQHPDAYLPTLAASLNNLSIDLGASGRREDGLTAIEEAVRIYQRLAEQHPDAYLPTLASSLNNLSIDLGASGRHEHGLTAIEEAVRIRRRLAEQHPDAYLPDLASSLTNLAIRLGALGRREDGLTAIEEAVRIYQRLAEQHPVLYNADMERTHRVADWLRSASSGDETS